MAHGQTPGHHHDHDHDPGQGRTETHTHTHSHGHGHGHGDVDWAAMGTYLERYAKIAAPMYREAAAWVRQWTPKPGVVADVGSGPGGVAFLLAEAFPGAQVIAADPEEPLLERARDRAEREGVADRFSTVRVELPDSIGQLPPADLLWLGKSLHHVGDQGAALAALAERLAPGGALALLEGGLSARSLPRDIGFGTPGLQARMEAYDEEWFAGMRASLPGAKRETEDWPALLGAAGLRHVASRSFLLDLPAPLSADARAHLVDELTRRREMRAESLAADDDLATIDRLIDPADPAGLMRRPDVFLLAVQTVHVAVKDDGATS
ncbi:class I SAM-dependent methyltransferase [Streptomyces sp. NPDC059002]|uniref:class I SAM-dependent methyltransferase n=1 Tax=Streptomyces sp. NPDC059002 TaxID=3346690 RepID=UPI0036CCFBD8